jgi:hypothetical protein
VALGKGSMQPIAVDYHLGLAAVSRYLLISAIVVNLVLCMENWCAD